MRLAVLFVLALPLLEIAGFIVVGQFLGVLPTLGLILLSAVAGLFLLRIQGLGALQRLRTSAPLGVEETGLRLVNGALLAVAAILLLVPGFISDAIALLLLVPPIRALIVRRMLANMVVMKTGATTGFSYESGDIRNPRRPDQGPVIDLDDAEFQREADRRNADTQQSIRDESEKR